MDEFLALNQAKLHQLHLHQIAASKQCKKQLGLYKL